MPSTNITMLQTVAVGLRYLKDDMVFVGGAVAELYASNAELSDIRPTVDVDCVIELRSKAAHAKLEDNLRTLGFANDTSKEAPICRWIYQNIMVDIMPSNSSVLGFSNRWYDEGIKNKISKTLPNGTKIFLFPPEYYLAAKFEAHNGRGGNDLRQSHDFEDIIYMLDNCSDLLENIQMANVNLKDYLKNECTDLLNDVSLIEGIECALPYGSSEETTEIMLELIQNIAAIKN